MRRALLALSLAACAGDVGSTDQPDANTSSDGAVCGIELAYDPIDPVASSVSPVRVYSLLLNPQGVLTFTWTVNFGSFTGPSVSFSQEAADGTQIGFIAKDPGTYYVNLEITGPGQPGCNSTSKAINVLAPGAIPGLFRLRTVPSPSLAPPQETVIQVQGGADAQRTIALDTGISTSGTVRNNTNTAIAAYLKFMPSTMPAAYSEQYAPSTGAYSLRLLPINHDVLVIPSSTALAPKLVTWTPTTQTLSVGPGTAVSGIVRGPGGAGFAGAKVVLSAGNVPSTIGTTAADGTFTVRTDFPTNATVITVKVTPPLTSGLPRLEATGAFTLGSQLQINYASTLQTCNLINVPVRRGTADQANARVSVVGSLAGTAGTVIAGITVSAANTVRVSAVADGSGRLPSMFVPRGALTAVTELSMTDHAASAIDTSACAVAQIDAPAMTTIAGTTKNITMSNLGGIRIEAEPVGALALAGVLPVQIASTTSGAYTLPLAGGGRYNVRFTDPNARAAPLVVTDILPGGVPTNAVLPKAIAIYGPVEVVNNTNPVIGASVQLLCASCSGIDVARPIAETATDSQSNYRIAVPDPGTM